MIPVNEPLIGKQEEAYVRECLHTGWISSSGRFIEQFEEKWADYCGKKFGVAVSSGTAALQVALGCIGLEPGDRVVLPTFTIISCALAVIYNGGIPVLADCDPHTWCLSPEGVKDAIDREVQAGNAHRLKAIMPVHIYGHPVDVDPILELADTYSLTVLEDAAEAHGAEYLAGRTGGSAAWKRCGGLSDLAVFSFYANKAITTGEGGMVITDNAMFAEKARSLRNLCFRPEQRFLHTEAGHNFRMTNIQAAIGLGQLERIETILEKKKAIGKAYGERLSDLRDLMLPIEEPWAKSIYWMFGIVLEEETGINASQMAQRLRDKGIDTRPFFLGMHEQPVFHKMGLFKNEKYPVSERLARQGLYLPSGLTLTESQIDEVAEAVRNILT
ncbi:perosamine synthetase [Syntrophus gentianae]|uniref:Perosamine synthetase n=1 Tax=Syntrophus gentianae TaxID=43775 RepID=A0A1H7W8Q9_9BACT|nr:DegT/DnrJ/EryC1/StrS family aminotransferase [Syntrophus gentianae]SEM17883.1 perosamine synthetase [Syntrophus gentianae]